MPAHYLQSSSIYNELPLPPHHRKVFVKKPPTISERIQQYAECLMNSEDKGEVDNALNCLLFIDAPMQVFQQIEDVLERCYSERVEFMYQVNKLSQKFEKLRMEEQKRRMDQVEEMEVDEEEEEEEYDPEYPEIRSSMEMKKYKLPKTSTLLEEYAVYIPTPIDEIDESSGSSSEESVDFDDSEED